MKSEKTISGGFFITLEGPEGAGKSTQANRLAQALRDRGYAVTETREPGGTALGEELRRLVKHFGAPGSVCAEAELLLFGASRAQIMRELILPRLAAGGVVVCDRFADSTTVYQGFGRGLDLEFIDGMHRLTLGGRWPDLTLLLDLAVDTGFDRRERRDHGAPADRIEAESRDFHQRVREGFLNLARRSPQRVHLIDAAGAPAAVQARIMEVVSGALG